MDVGTTPDATTFDASGLIKVQYASNTNLSTEIELQEQAAIAQSAFVEADNGDGEVNFEELKKICEKLGLDLDKDEEEAMITSHRRHIDSMVSGLKEQMETLNEVDQPGSDVEHYVKSLLDGLQEQEKRILELRSGLRTFKKNLDEERLVSEQAEQLHRDALRAGGP